MLCLVLCSCLHRGATVQRVVLSVKWVAVNDAITNSVTFKFAVVVGNKELDSICIHVPDAFIVNELVALAIDVLVVVVVGVWLTTTIAISVGVSVLVSKVRVSLGLQWYFSSVLASLQVVSVSSIYQYCPYTTP